MSVPHAFLLARLVQVGEVGHFTQVGGGEGQVDLWRVEVVSNICIE